MSNNFINAVLQSVGTASTVLYASPAAQKSVVIQLDIANTTTSTVLINVNVTINATGVTIFLVKGAPIPVGGALQVIAGQKIVLGALDSISITSSAAASVDAICAILQNVQ